MLYRENGNVEFYEEHLRDIVLRQHSMVGPWLVMGLGIVLVLFLSYLIYSNLWLAPAIPSSRERSLRTMSGSDAAREEALPNPSGFSSQPPWGPTMTSVPQSRATNALLGGEGPALHPRHLTATAHSLSAEGSRAAVVSP